MIQILPRNPGEDNIGSSAQRWNVGYFNEIDLRGNKAMILVGNNEETVIGTGPGIMKQLDISQTYINQPILFDTWGLIKMTSTRQTGSVLVAITVNLKNGANTIKSFTLENTLAPNYAMTLPFSVSAIVDNLSSLTLTVEIEWTPSSDFGVQWKCECLRAYRI